MQRTTNCVSFFQAISSERAVTAASQLKKYAAENRLLHEVDLGQAFVAASL
jgi:hypothetical protein